MEFLKKMVFLIKKNKFIEYLYCYGEKEICVVDIRNNKILSSKYFEDWITTLIPMDKKQVINI